MPEPVPQPRPRRRLLRLVVSLRTLMLFVLVVGGGIGWVVHRARVQREAVAAIRNAGGLLYYGPDFSPPIGPDGKPMSVVTPSAVAKARQWLAKRVGIDYIDSLRRVRISGSIDDSVTTSLGELPTIQDLYLLDGNATDAGMANLGRLTELNSLWLIRGKAPITGAVTKPPRPRPNRAARGGRSGDSVLLWIIVRDDSTQTG